MPGGVWVRLALFGIVVYTLTQGSLFLSLSYLPANPVSLILNLTPLLVAAGSLAIGGERPTALQGLGILVAAGGVAAFFLPVGIVPLPAAGVAALVVCLGSNAISSLMGRAINRRLDLPPLAVTFVAMAAGSIALLALGLGTEGFGTWKPEHWWIVVWLAVVNTALTFTLWNHTLRTLTAVESSVLNGLMLPQIVLLAYLFLGESLTGRQIAGLVLVGVGTLVVQIRRESGRLPSPPGSPSPSVVDV
jgi:drug/metabolite transporter (DMT)-like permease